MSTTETILLIAAAIVVLALIAWAAMRASDKNNELRRQKAREHQQEGIEHETAAARAEANASIREARADKARAEAQEKAAIAQREEAVAARQSQEASEQDELAREHLERAESIHPGDIDEEQNAAARARFDGGASEQNRQDDAERARAEQERTTRTS